jgi:phenylpropionate dioxygenase-like ring-hydroxylating dioxygenase large terminal subunit
MDDGRPLVRPEVRVDLVPADAYVSPEYVKREEEKLWPKVWLIACREEELRKVGDFVTFDIGNESILIVKSKPDQVKAFYNVCQHRGRRLKDTPCGHTGLSIRCPFHGWTYKIDGAIQKIYCKGDWDGISTFNEKDLGLKDVRLETFAGWIWVTMDPKIEPLRDYLGPVVQMLEPYEFEDTRIAWHHQIVVPCNWKVIVDAFNEAYHAPSTHPTSFPFGSPGSFDKVFGKHGGIYQRSLLEKDLGEKIIPVQAGPVDMRDKIVRHAEYFYHNSHCMVSRYALQAARRVKQLPDGMSDAEVMGKWMQFHREEMEAEGAKWADKLTPEFLATVPTFHHVFPNTSMVPVLDGALWHRMRPNGPNPESAIWDIWCLERFPPGKEPGAKTEYFPNPEAFKGRNPFLEEDFSNMIAVQKGMLSRGYHGGRTNPLQELTVSNFHKYLYDYLFAEN